MSVNNKSVLLSGLVAGITIIVSAMAMVPVVGNEMDKALADRGLLPLSKPAMAYFGICSAGYGYFSYMAVRGCKSSIRAREKDGGDRIHNRLVPGLFFMQCLDGGIWIYAHSAYRDRHGLGPGGIVIGGL